MTSAANALSGSFVEWCDDTPITRKPGFFRLRTGAGFSQNLTGVFCRWHLGRVTTSTSPCRIPPSDPVLEAKETRVIEFLRTTFFDNAPALECQLAAMSSTLRGSNIVRAFTTLGPGGVGQSLDVFGDMHGDMNVFYTEDELRKQADTFTGKVRT